MVEKLTAMVVSQMARENIIRHEMKEHYIYVLTILAEKFITIFTIVGISLIVERLVETVIFFSILFCITKKNGRLSCEKFLAVLSKNHNNVSCNSVDMSNIIRKTDDSVWIYNFVGDSNFVYWDSESSQYGYD